MLQQAHSINSSGQIVGFGMKERRDACVPTDTAERRPVSMFADCERFRVAFGG